MRTVLERWTPAALLLAGALVTLGVDTQRAMPLRESLEVTVPENLAGYTGSDEAISDEEIRVVGVSDYLYRIFEPPTPAASGSTDTPAPAAGEASEVEEGSGADTTREAGAPFSLYVGYYEQQSRGKTIHSPKNCLPGAGWEALTSTTREIPVGDRTYTVNQYLIKRGDQQAMVLYWYQGRGRVEANEYRVKFDLLKDSALTGRSDEALVRLVVPVTENEEKAGELAARAAATVIPAVDRALPA